MRTDVIAVSNSGLHMDEALEQAEKVAAYKNLSPKGALHLRLLTEEMLGMMRSITGTAEGKFWIDNEGDCYELHLKAESFIDGKKREALLAASTSGRNEATRGFMGKIRAFFETPGDVPSFHGNTFPGAAPTSYGSMVWSMDSYREQLSRYSEEQKEGAKEAWDELEKSVVARIADNVTVSIRGHEVEMTISKKIA